MLVIYCLRNVSLFTGSHGLPEAIAIGLVGPCTCGSGKCCCPLPGARRAICCWYSWCFNKFRKQKKRPSSSGCADGEGFRILVDKLVDK